jgi:polyribonucleotide nucleotidyltransferase
MISDITAVPEIGKTYLGKVVRLAEFGAFVEIFPGTDGLLHVSEIAEHRVAQVKDELREGDQILVKVLAIEGNRIKLSRKAVLREQRAKLGLDEGAPEGGDAGHSGDSGRAQRGGRSAAPPAAGFDGEEDGDSEVLLEGGADFDDDEADDVDDEGGEEVDVDSDSDADAEPNFNRADPVPAGAPAGGGRGPGGGGDRGPGRGPGGGGDRGGRGPGGGGGRGPGGGGGGRRRRGGGGGGRGPGGAGGNSGGGGNR